MFQQLIEAIRIESSQSGGRNERTPGQGTFSHGPMTDHGQKQAELKADKKKRRRMGKEAAQTGDDGSVGKRGGRKVPKHPKKITPWGSRNSYHLPHQTRKGRHRARMKKQSLMPSAEPTDEGIRDLASKGVDKILPRRAKKKAARKADDKRRNANYARNQASLKRAVARIKTNY
jgi:hypothetical protein